MSPQGAGRWNDEEVNKLQARLLSLEAQVGELTDRLDNAVSSLVKLTQVVRELNTLQRQAAAPAAAAPPARDTGGEARAGVTPRMLEVIGLVQQGKGEEAQALLQSMPQAELAAQPAIVTLAAATLCLQRGDIQACLKALKRARGFTSDPRLLKVLERVEAKAQSQTAPAAAVKD